MSARTRLSYSASEKTSDVSKGGIETGRWICPKGSLNDGDNTGERWEELGGVGSCITMGYQGCKIGCKRDERRDTHGMIRRGILASSR